MGTVKYTKEVLEPLVRESRTLVEILRKLGIENYSGGMSNHIHSRIKKFGLDTSHFLWYKANSGPTWKGVKRTPDELLVKRPRGSYRESTYRLRRALLAIGREYVCSFCRVGDSWNGSGLVLEIDHINSDRLDNRRENLRFLCPNCHSQETKNNARVAQR